VLKTWCCSAIRFFRFSCRLSTVNHVKSTRTFRNALAEGQIHRSPGAQGAEGDRRPRLTMGKESVG